MAAAKKAAAKKAAGKSVVPWEERLAKYAEASVTQEKDVGGGHSFFSIKSGILSFDDSPIPGNHMGAIILDGVVDRAFYEGDYDPDNNEPPICFAIAHTGQDENGDDYPELKPHESVFAAGQAQAETCAECPWNEWGSAEKGPGKACKERRRLALLPAGKLDKQGTFTLEEEPEHYRKADMAFLRVPTTSMTGYAGYVKQTSKLLKKPTFAVATLISVVPDPKNQIAVKFEALEEIPIELLSEIGPRFETAREEILFPYSLEKREQTTATKRKAKPGAARAKPVAAKKGATKKAAAVGGRRY